MKTLEQITNDYKSETIDGRDLNRLSVFMNASQLKHFGFTLKEGMSEEEWNKGIKPFTKENILIQLEKDVAFGFEKALNQRGISSGLMYDVVSMWNWILEEGLEDFKDYAQYGLPLFKATAVKYGFPNEIGDDNGDEAKYSSDYGED